MRNMLGVSNCVIIAGTGGLGKSMMMHHLALDAIDSYFELGLLPVFIQLMKFTEGVKSLDSFVFKEVKTFDADITKAQFKHLLEEGSCLFLFDGWDEIGSAHLSHFENCLGKFVRKYPACKYIISSRPVKSFASYHKFVELSLQPLDLDQAVTLVRKSKFRVDAPSITENFVAELEGGLFEAHEEYAGNPLLLSIMLLIYERTAKIPTQTHKFYKEAFEALAERHDSNKGYNRRFKSGLTKELLEECLAEICFASYKAEQYELSEKDIEGYFDGLQIALTRQDHSKPEFPDFLYDVCSNLCLIYFDGGVGRFIHRSFQEYFAAVFLDNAFSIVSTERKQQWCEFLIGFFEERSDYENRVLGMLYEMAPEKVEEYVFAPFLEDLLAGGGGQGPGALMRVFEIMFPTLSFWYENSALECSGSEAGWADGKPTAGLRFSGERASGSNVLEFVVKGVLKGSAFEDFEIGGPKYEYGGFIMNVPLVAEELKRFESELHKPHDSDAGEAGDKDTMFVNYTVELDDRPHRSGVIFSVGFIRKNAEMFTSLLSLIDSDEFPAKRACQRLIPHIQKYLQDLKLKQDKRDNSYFDILRP